MKSPNKPRFLYNDDTCSLRHIPGPHTPQQVAKAIDYLKNTQVEAFCWSLTAGDVAWSWPSKVLENAFDLCDRPLFEHENSTNLMLGLYKQGIDYLPFLIKCAQDNGIRFFGSFRMNDTHHKSQPESALAGAFWTTHQHYRLWEVTDFDSYKNAALDYSYRKVRNLKLRAITEVVNKYDLDGIEVDFCRSPYTFPPSKAWSKRKILTDFIKDIRRIVKAAGKKRGRKMEMIIRVPFQENKRLNAGMDVKDWIAKKYMDILVMSTLANNYNQSVEPWLSLCRKKGIPFYPSVESGPEANARYNHVVPETTGEIANRMRAGAQNFLAQGVDGIYMFNHPCRLFDEYSTRAQFNQLAAVLSENGDLKTLQGKPKQYTYWSNLPFYVESNRPPQYHQTLTFRINDPAVTNSRTKTTLTFRQIAIKNPHAPTNYRQNPIVPPDWIDYYLNGHLIKPQYLKRRKQPAGQIPSGFTLDAHEQITIRPPAAMMKNGANTLAFHIDKFPAERDPYVYIYELVVDTFPQAAR